MRKMEGDRVRDIVVELPEENDLERYVGLKVHKKKTVCVCTGFRWSPKYDRLVLVWKCTLILTGETLICEKWAPVAIADLPASRAAFINYRNRQKEGNE